MLLHHSFWMVVSWSWALYSSVCWFVLTGSFSLHLYHYIKSPLEGFSCTHRTRVTVSKPSIIQAGYSTNNSCADLIGWNPFIIQGISNNFSRKSIDFRESLSCTLTHSASVAFFNCCGVARVCVQVSPGRTTSHSIFYQRSWREFPIQPKPRSQIPPLRLLIPLSKYSPDTVIFLQWEIQIYTTSICFYPIGHFSSSLYCQIQTAHSPPPQS